MVARGTMIGHDPKQPYTFKFLASGHLHIFRAEGHTKRLSFAFLLQQWVSDYCLGGDGCLFPVRAALQDQE
jgi:hypothetical protein